MLCRVICLLNMFVLVFYKMKRFTNFESVFHFFFFWNMVGIRWKHEKRVSKCLFIIVLCSMSPHIYSWNQLNSLIIKVIRLMSYSNLFMKPTFYSFDDFFPSSICVVGSILINFYVCIHYFMRVLMCKVG